MSEEVHKLFVGGLPPDISEADLTHVFATYGEVSQVHIMGKASESTGNKAAFVCYKQRKSGEDAIQVLNKQYKIRETAAEPIQVSWAKGSAGYTEQGSSGGGGGNAESSDGFKLFVGNLPADCTEDEVNTVFSTYGAVAKVRMMDGATVTRQKCALVFYQERKAAEDAIAVLNDQYKIRVDAESPIVVRWGHSKKDGKGDGKGKDQGKGGGYGGWQDKGNDDKGGWQNNSSGWNSGGGGWNQGNSGWQDNNRQSSGWQSNQSSGWQSNDNKWNSGNSWNSNSWSSNDSGNNSWGQDRGNDKGGKGGSKGGSSEPGTKLFVGNLPPNTPQENINYVFSTYGKVQNIHILASKPSPNGSVAAFVEYEDIDQATTAITSLHDKYEIQPGYGHLTVKYANNKAKPY